MILVDDGDVGADACILIENGALHGRALTHTQRNATTFLQDGTLVAGFEEISTHHQGVLEDHIAFNATANAENAVVNAAGFQNRAFTDDGIGDLSINKFARRKVTGAGVDRKFFVVEAEGGCGLLGERQIGFVERPDRSNVFPVIIENITFQLVTTLESFRDDFLTEIRIAGVGIEKIKELE